MTTIGERVRLIRKSDKIHMTLVEFGKKLGVGKTALSSIETGVNNLTEQMKLSICREFCVNQKWLETGEGEMFVQACPPELGDLKARYGLGDDAVIMIEKFISLDPEQRQAVIDYVKSVAASLGVSVSDSQENTSSEENDRSALHAALDRQLDEEKGVMGKSEVS